MRARPAATALVAAAVVVALTPVVAGAADPESPSAPSTSAVNELSQDYRERLTAAADTATERGAIDGRVAAYEKWLSAQGDLATRLPSAENKYENWRLSQFGEGRSPSPEQFEVGWTLSEDLGSATRPAGVPDLGEPAELYAGVIGYTRDETGNYHLKVGRGADASKVTGSLAVAGGVDKARASGALTVSETSNSAATYLAAWAAVRKTANWTAAARPTYLMGLDPESERIEVTLSPEVSDAAASRLAALSPVIKVNSKRSKIERHAGGRTNDAPAHYGGASIRRSNGDDTTTRCTSGFTVYGLGTGNYYGSTTGHCGPNGSVFYTGNYTYGALAGVNMPEVDAARVTGSSYTFFIYTDPIDATTSGDNFDIRQVNSYADGDYGDPVCYSGARTGSQCGLVISGLNQTLCDASGCTYHLGQGATPGMPLISDHGNSGGPVYFRTVSDNRSGARGLLVGSVDGDHLLWTKISTLRDGLNVLPVTTP